jgi:hypothetical protein
MSLFVEPGELKEYLLQLNGMVTFMAHVTEWVVTTLYVLYVPSFLCCARMVYTACFSLMGMAV